MRGLAAIYRAIGRQTEEIKLLEPALATLRAELGDANPVTINSIEQLGNLKESVGEFEEASRLFQEASDRWRMLLAAEHVVLLNSVLNTVRVQIKPRCQSLRGEILLKQSKFDETEKFLRLGHAGLESQKLTSEVRRERFADSRDRRNRLDAAREPTQPEAGDR